MVEEKRAKVIACCDAWFVRLDANGDGNVDRAECTNFFTETFAHKEDGAAQAAEYTDGLFGVADANNDGKLTKEEMIGSLSGYVNACEETDLDSMIERYEAKGYLC